MYCLDHAERPHPDDQLSFMLHEQVFLGCHSQFPSYPYTFASYSHSCNILKLYVVATVRMHSDALLYTKQNTDRMLKFDSLRAGPYACVRTGVWTG